MTGFTPTKAEDIHHTGLASQERKSEAWHVTILTNKQQTDNDWWHCHEGRRIIKLS